MEQTGLKLQLNTARDSLAGSGTSTSAIAIGGAPNRAITEQWNGSNWTEVNDLNNGRGSLAATAQDATNALAFGGTSPTVGDTEIWNGTNWTETTNLSTVRAYLGGAGTYTSAIAFAGQPSGTATEEFTGAGPVTRTFTDS